MSVTAHPELPEFDYIRPVSLMEASRFLVEHAYEARPFLGGTDVFVRMRDGDFKPHYLVDVKNLDGVGDIHYDPSNGLTIGAAVNMNRVIACQAVKDHYPLLAEACNTVAAIHYAIAPRWLGISATPPLPGILWEHAWHMGEFCAYTE
jgi:carbon-monoxide dehydrogenase medium subunit